ncbi:MAG TPA: hypothetical protein EYQ15_04975 [Candidatus Poseidoniales archaeon]|nr:MAG: hypothetical protein CXT65_01600 [Euryarchaeota archaeon]HIG38637.1 hypothetical protein [Candidatus Poseidoniales archaeon]HIL43506.1 hypothetical protein [Candidatus Poseidoniales archaeon]
MTEAEIHLLDTETWEQQELLEVICSRYFVLGSQGLAEYSWEVNGREGRSPSASLRSLNRHLKDLSLIAVLDEGDPPLLSVCGLPSQVMVMPAWQQALVWVLVTGFVTMAGALWVTHLNPAPAVLESAILQTSLVFFALPVMGSVLLASYARIFVSDAFEVESNHLIPLAFPVMSPEWPFSLISAIGQMRPDLHPIPNRRALGFIELTTPTVMFVCGSILTILGLGMTSNQPPAYEAAPIVVDTNSLVDILGSVILSSDVTLKLQWIHPTGLAGIALSLAGWALLLPIPGFPGDRILHALIGPGDMQEGSNQTSIFIATLGFALLIFISTEYWPWLLLAAIAAWRRFSPEQMPSPFVVDEYAGLDEIQMRQIASLTLIILLLGYPGLEPSYEMEDWDKGLSTESWPTHIFFEDGNTEVELSLEPVGVMPVSGWLQMRIEGAPFGGWQIDSECMDEREVCRFDDITQATPGSVSVSMNRDQMEASEQTFRLVILLDVADHVSEYTIVFHPTGVTSPIDPLWVMVEDTQTPRICVEIMVVEGDYVNLTNYDPFWSFENETSLGPGIHDLCMRGHEGALQSLSLRDDQYRRLGPSISLSRENLSNDVLFLPIEGTQPIIQVSDGVWRIPEWFESNSEYVIARGESGSAFCPSTDVIAEVNASGDWVRDLADRSSILLPAGEIDNATLRFSASGWLALCQGTTMLASYRVVEGPDVMVDPGTLSSRMPNGEFSIVNRENTSMSISLDWTGDAVAWDNWEAWAPSEVAAMSSVTANASVHGAPFAWWAAWVTADEDGITLHFAARSWEAA